MMIRNMFAEDINRQINGVIKVDQDTTDVIEQEVREYVITKELKKHFISFFDYYSDSFDKPTDDIGVWISGFFGSGKSHFLKMLSFILENKSVGGVPTVEMFRKKFADDPATFMLIDKAILLVMMLLPAVASVITRVVRNEGFERMLLRPHLRRNLKWYFTAYFAPPFIACFGAAVYFLIFGSDFSPLQSAFAIQESIISTSELLKTLCILIPLAIIVNPIMGMIQCFGEELGWRGYLLPKIGEKLSPLSASIFTGVIWGLWHAPIIAMGYNYGTNNPIAGIFAMTVFCTVLGIISGFLTYKVRSIWPAVLFHASINGMDRWAPSTLFMSKKPNMFLGPDLLGFIGGLGFIIIDVVLIMNMRKWKKGEI